MPIAITPTPLNIPDPDRDARQLSGKAIDLQPQHILRARRQVHLLGKAQFHRFDMRALLDGAQGRQTQIQKIPRPTGRIEDAKLRQTQHESVVVRLGRPPGGILGDPGLDLRPFRAQRLRNQRIDQFPNRRRVRVVRTDRHALLLVQTPLEQRPEDRRIDRAPVAQSRRVQIRNVLAGQLRDIDDLEQPAIEPSDVVMTIGAAAALLHRPEQLSDRFGRLLRSRAPMIQQ